LLNSKKDLAVDGSFKVRVGTMKRSQRGGGRRYIVKSDHNDARSDIAQKRAIFTIKAIPNQYLCAARAITISLMKLQLPAKQFKKYSQRSNEVRLRAEQLQKRVGLPLDRQVTVRELHLFEQCLNCQIIVISGDLMNEVSYVGSLKRDSKIFLYLKVSRS
jgi:fructose-1,6-bisphosphatase/sedoheptulose 1,7-bisphosphatase-like protein